MAVLLSRVLFRSRLRSRAHICFIDNDTAKASLVAGYCDAELACRVVGLISEDDVLGQLAPWYDRVPSESNVADRPSRGLPPVHVTGWGPATEVDCAAELAEVAQVLQGPRRRDSQLRVGI